MKKQYLIDKEELARRMNGKALSLIRSPCSSYVTGFLEAFEFVLDVMGDMETICIVTIQKGVGSD